MKVPLINLRGWALVMSVLLAHGNSFAAIPPSHYLLRDAGQVRDFELATDELEVRGPERTRLKFAPLSSLAALRQKAQALSQAGGGQACLVLYERGLPHNEFNRRVLTQDVAVRLKPGMNPSQLAPQVGSQEAHPLPGLPGWFLLHADAMDGALSLVEKLHGQPGVLDAEVQLARQKQKKMVPNDPYFSQQWHLRNIGQNGGTPGTDINVAGVWDTYRGDGIQIGIVDDGLQVSHPDLAGNVNTAIDWDFNGNDPDPSPNLNLDTHGTCVAGIAGAVGNNGLGVTGVAFAAKLVGLRLLGAPDSDAQDAAAILHSNAVIQVKNNSWGAYDGDGHLEGAGPLLNAAFEQAATQGRNGLGTVLVFAGGNGRPYGEDANYDGFANSRFVIAVGACSDQGQQASYSEPGACLLVCAPSSSGSWICSGGRQSITTTDLMGDNGDNYLGAYCELSDRDYTQEFTGTSAATPIVSGVVALVLEANPRLSYRDVAEILMRSATRISPADSDWQVNAAGIPHNHKFGAGLVNAGEAVALATNWLNLGPVTNLSLLQTNLNLAVPDNDAIGLTRTFVITNPDFRVEHVTLTVTLPHSHHGDLAITLTSPSGTASRLAERHNSTGSGYNGWTFNSVRHWGEDAEGVWTVKIADLAAYNTGTLQALDLELYGSSPEAILSIGLTNQLPLVTLQSPAVGWNYALETSTNLTTWEILTTLAIASDGRAAFLDTNAATRCRTYRARLFP